MKKLIRELASLPEPDMRRAKLLERLRGLGPEEIVEVLHAIWNEQRKSNRAAQELFLLFMNPEFLVRGLGELLLSRVYFKAQEKKLPHVVQMLSIPVPRSYKGKEGLPPVTGLEGATLGHRKWMARKLDKNLLDRLLFDDDPSVIKPLLENPRLTERELIKLVARRPINSEVLKLVAQHPKWIKRYRVKKALAFNPYTPLKVAREVVWFLMLSDLKLLAEQVYMEEQFLETVREAIRAKTGT